MPHEWAGGKPAPRDAPAGWGRSVLMQQQHYFRRTHALCGRWVLASNHALTAKPGPHGFAGYDPTKGRVLEARPCRACWWRWQLGWAWRVGVALTDWVRARIH